MINIVFGRPIHSLRIFFKKQNKHKNLLFKYLYIYIASEIIRTREAEIVERGDSWKDVIILFRDISPGNADSCKGRLGIRGLTGQRPTTKDKETSKYLAFR